MNFKKNYRAMSYICISTILVLCFTFASLKLVYGQEKLKGKPTVDQIKDVISTVKANAEEEEQKDIIPSSDSWLQNEEQPRITTYSVEPGSNFSVDGADVVCTELDVTNNGQYNNETPVLKYCFIFFLIIIVFGMITSAAQKKVKIDYISKFQIEDVDMMSGREFEKFVATLLKLHGYTNISTTPYSGDHGVDILAKKDSVSYAIQCKRYQGRVGNKAIQEVFTGQHYYKSDIAVIVTNSYFTRQAIQEASRLKVKLWDRAEVIKLLKIGISK